MNTDFATWTLEQLISYRTMLASALRQPDIQATTDLQNTVAQVNALITVHLNHPLRTS